MKRIAMSLMVLAVASSCFSQKKMVSKAKTDLIDPIDLVDAQKSIEAAMGNAETSGDPKTFVVAGDVYKALYDAEAKKRIVNPSMDDKVLGNSLISAANSYMQAAVLEQVPDEKGKTTDKYDKDIKRAFGKITTPLITEGYTAYQAKKFDKSLPFFQAYLEIPNSPIMKDEPIDSNYVQIQLLAAQAAILAKKNDKAIEYLNELKESKLDDNTKATVYEWLFNVYQAQKDTAKSLEVLNEGLKKFPSNQYMISNQVNYYINHGKEKEAMKYLDDAIAANPNSPIYYNAKASLFFSQKKYDDALAMYQKASSVDATNVDAVEGLGVSYASKGQDLDDKADRQFLKTRKNCKQCELDADKAYQQSKTYLEKAHSMYKQPNKENLLMLRTIYNRLKDGANKKKIDEEYKNAQF